MGNRSKPDPYIVCARSVPSHIPNTVTVDAEDVGGEESSESGEACKPFLISISHRLCWRHCQGVDLTQ